MTSNYQLARYSSQLDLQQEVIKDITNINILIDIGNTNTKYRYIPVNTEWQKADIYPIYKFENILYNYTDFTKNNLPIITNLPNNCIINKIYISNVAKQYYSDTIKNIFSSSCNIENIYEYKTQAKFKNLINKYDDYTKLGVDRWLSIIAAHGLYPNTTNIVIGCGSATTLDIIYNNQFIGGYIIPGISYMQKSLIENTERIKNIYNPNNIDINLNINNIKPSTNTNSCINNGIIISQISFIEKSIFSFIKTQDIVEYNCIIYGGCAKQICPFISFPHLVFDNMVILGLARVLNG